MRMKDIKDYLHLYLGATCTADGNEFVLAGVELTDTGTLAYDGTMIDGIHQCWWVENCDFKLFLRPLSDMTDKENDELDLVNTVGTLGYNAQSKFVFNAQEIVWLLSKHFDLFGLIESDLAIFRLIELL